MRAIDKQATLKNQDVTAVDIPIMDNLSTLEYQQYLNDEGLFYIDHYEKSRSSRADYPVTTKE